MNKIEYLKEITLSIQAGTSEEVMDLTPKHPIIRFIFGIGPQGMTTFEYELVDKYEGDIVLLHLLKKDFYRFFEHLNPSFMDLFEGRDQVYLKAIIEAVIPADNRNIVKAMADMATHSEIGCGCSGEILDS